ncbi:hypothetical protein [Colwellia psychrerythraea]|uniref:Uncharacterized protein n=1 Tax=Colwellia psychrerythraea TaxID=28229 RepID=A0A099KHW7_COLPS|nr:hypothetical protein [Colwellia psychrerythraea]KGJ90409.1 hypothetical protein GAB14E_3652 [Colwellia psychrerythraea]
MNKYIKVVSLLLALTGSIYLPSANAASSTDMLITIAETNPVLVDRLNDIALNDPELLQQLMKMADSDANQLERLLNIAEYNPLIFAKIVNIKNVETAQKLTLKAEEQQVSPYGQMSTFGTIDDSGGIIQN